MKIPKLYEAHLGCLVLQSAQTSMNVAFSAWYDDDTGQLMQLTVAW